MKVYVVVEYAVIEREECTQVMGVFSSGDKAAEAAVEFEKYAEGKSWHCEYSYDEYEVDQIWEQ